jgi:hypothetical protein
MMKNDFGVSAEAYAAYVDHETSPILDHALEWISAESEWRLELERVRKTPVKDLRKIDGRVVDVVGEAVRAFPAAETEDSIERLCNADESDIPEVVVSHLLAAFKASDHFESYLEWYGRLRHGVRVVHEGRIGTNPLFHFV